MPPGATWKPEVCLEFDETIAAGEQQEPGVGARRVPLLDGSSHDLDVGNGSVGGCFRTDVVTRR
jgi:hypothetical protein